ncbi:MAG: hypothetical protein ABI868_13050 [Acidobacteriota bacterium]
MKRCLAVCALVALGSAAVRADVTVTTEVTIDGPMAAMMSGAMPRLIMRVKGNKARTDIEVMGQSMATITDLTTRQVTVLTAGQKTAQVFDAARLQGQVAGAPAPPRFDATFEPTGKTQTIAGQLCEQFSFSTSMDMAQFGSFAPQMPKEALEMLQGAKMVTKGVVWVAKSAPGAAEYAAYMKAAMAANLLSPPVTGGGPAQGNLDQAMRLFGQADGIAYLSEAELSLEGNAPILEMLKQMATMKMTNKVTDVSVAPIGDDQFVVPADYTVTRP